MVVDRDARIRSDDAGELSFESPEQPADESAACSPPRIGWMRTDDSRAVENVDTVPFHASRVEPKGQRPVVERGVAPREAFVLGRVVAGDVSRGIPADTRPERAVRRAGRRGPDGRHSGTGRLVEPSRVRSRLRPVVQRAAQGHWRRRQRSVQLPPPATHRSLRPEDRRWVRVPLSRLEDRPTHAEGGAPRALRDHVDHLRWNVSRVWARHARWPLRQRVALDTLSRLRDGHHRRGDASSGSRRAFDRRGGRTL